MAVLAYRNSQPEARDFWKQEMKHAVDEIRRMYDDKLEAMRGQMESNCTVKVMIAFYPASTVYCIVTDSVLLTFVFVFFTFHCFDVNSVEYVVFTRCSSSDLVCLRRKRCL